MHCTCYVSKGTQSEDDAAFHNAAKAMVRSTAKKQKEMQENGTDADVLNECKMGMNSLIGSVFVATGTHTCSATLGAHLVRNTSRFLHSHDFQCVNLKDHHKEEPADYSLNNANGNFFLTSACQNYTKRGRDLENVPSCRFLHKCYVGRGVWGNLLSRIIACLNRQRPSTTSTKSYTMRFSKPRITSRLRSPMSVRCVI